MSYRDSIVDKIPLSPIDRFPKHFPEVSTTFDYVVMCFVLIARERKRGREKVKTPGQDVIISISPRNRQVEVKELSIEPNGTERTMIDRR